MKKRKSTPPRPPAVKRPRFRRLEAGRLLALGCVITLIWCAVFNRFSVQAWRVPLDYGIDPILSDAKQQFSLVKAAMDGDFVPFLPRFIRQLGAPYTANWNDFPLVEKFLYLGAGLLARLVGIFVATNSMVLVLHLLAGAAFYVTCRMFRCRWEWAFAGALAFAFSRYAFAQSLHHLTTVYYWHAPLFVLVAAWIVAGLRFRTPRYYAAAAVAVITGMQSPYYTNAFLQLVAIACLALWYRRGWRSVLAPASLVAVTGAVFLAMNVNTFFCNFVLGPNPGAVARSFKWLDIYGLKMVDMFVPPPVHGFEPFAELGKSYYSQTILPGEVPPGSYLGLAGIGALLWLACVTLVRLFRRPPRPAPMAAFQVGWLLLYSVTGGVNALLGVFGLLLFRATNRFTVVILAIVLIFAVRRLSALTRAWQPAARIAVAAMAALFVLLDQLPPWTTDAEIAQTASVVDSDRAFAANLERRLPNGAMIFQIPIMEFPESPAPGVSSYEHFRPYLFTEHLRYSFGTVKGRPRDQWQFALAKLPIPEIVNRLEAYGFSAVYIDRRGFADRGAALLDGLKAAGRAEVLQDTVGELMCVFLKPSPKPVLPFSS